MGSLAFSEFRAALLDLRDAIQNPPDGFATVAERLLEAVRVVKRIQSKFSPEGGFTAYLNYFTDLNTISQAGWHAVKEVAKARRLEDPFAFVDAPAADGAW